MIIRDYMSSEVVTANLRDGLRQTWVRMHEHNVRHMPVLDDGGNLAGIITDRDVRRPEGLDTPNTTQAFALDNKMHVEEAMTPRPTTISPEATIAEALELFLKRKYGALPVVDGDGRLRGIISTWDLLRAFQDSI